MSKHSNLSAARKNKNDEFYTRLTDIEKELQHYKDHFRNKVVYCNCDDARESNFFKYFSLNFEFLGLKKLISTGYKENGHGVVLVYEGDKNGNRKVDDEEIVVTELEGDGDFRSTECVEFLKEADIVVTNPPFSLFREYVAQLMEYNKKFLIIGNGMAVSYKEIFKLAKDDLLWFGINSISEFLQPDKSIKKFGNVTWYTNLEHRKRHEPIDLYKKYNSASYPTYDNYDAIEVKALKDIPCDYYGVMGVPISLFYVYCPEQFEIIDINPHFFSIAEQGLPKPKQLSLKNVGMKDPYARILVRRKK